MDTTNTSVTATERYKLNKELAQMLGRRYYEHIK